MKKSHLFVALPIAAIAIAIAVFVAWQARRTAGPDASPSTTGVTADSVTGDMSAQGVNSAPAGQALGQGGEAAQSSTGGSDGATVGDSGRLAAGRIEVAPELLDRSKQIGIVYVMMRSAAGGPPYAVARLQNPRNGEPIPFELTSQNVMVQGVPLPSDAKIIVRFDADGSAGPEAPGDLVGEAPIDGAGSQAVTILVDREGGRAAQ